MTKFDFFLLLCVMASATLGMWRGLLQTALALGTWLVAAFVTYQYTYSLERMLAPRLPDEGIRIILSALLLFGLAMGAGKALQYITARFIKAAKLTIPDRILGGLFGAVRGLLFVTIFMMLVGASPLVQDSWWRSSTWVEKMTPVAQAMIDRLPDDLRRFYQLVK